MFRAARTLARLANPRIFASGFRARAGFASNATLETRTRRPVWRWVALGAAATAGAYVAMHRGEPVDAADYSTDASRLEKVFAKYATVNVDNVWYLSRDDFIKLVLSADVSAKVHQSDSELDVLFRVADQNRDNLVSLSDFKMFYSFLTNPESEFELAFKMFDSDGSGEISKGRRAVCIVLCGSLCTPSTGTDTGTGTELKAGLTVLRGPGGGELGWLAR